MTHLTYCFVSLTVFSTAVTKLLTGGGSIWHYPMGSPLGGHLPDIFEAYNNMFSVTRTLNTSPHQQKPSCLPVTDGTEGLTPTNDRRSSHCPLVMDSLSSECAPLISRPLGLLLTVQFWLLYTSMDRTCWLHTPAFYMLNFNFCVATNISSYYCMMISTSMSPSIGVKMHQVFLNSPNNSK